MTRAWRLPAVLAGAVALASCDNSPAAPALFTTETFNGSVGRVGTSHHTFITGQDSPTIIRIASLTPSISMGLALGTPLPLLSGEVCQVTVGQATVQQGDTFQVQLTPATYCVAIFDVGSVVESSTVAYSVTVQHR